MKLTLQRFFAQSARRSHSAPVTLWDDAREFRFFRTCNIVAMGSKTPSVSHVVT